LLCFLKKIFSRLYEITRQSGVRHRLSHAQLMLNLLSLSFSSWKWHNTTFSHVVYQLVREFLQSFFSEQRWVIFKFIEWNKLYNICRSIPLQYVRVESFIIPVKSIHIAEVSIPNTNDNNRKRIIRATDYLIDSLGHIIYYTIGYDQEDLKLLIIVSCSIRFANLI
jgi:hypothetical protein